MMKPKSREDILTFGLLAICLIVVYVMQIVSNGWWGLLTATIQLIIVVLVVLGVNRLLEWARRKDIEDGR